ncbi:glycosyl transferase family 2 [Xylanimonas cellulosilytica DSM 15894]|uniref:Glycosyl transferase family 2 n=1 Tax=Xylanimonas cellulosilytica (strain DSM 15894 / JCM 12276 / CECT 5975 / KCTC 9989 / LMG 20990 / NBRC 107835 / XIL07) TaxID=446471 RepID=D1BZ13_XYLCX|nr:glycosyl transferase family 2 [Xylanimonas cellulosilytica DSM 15894]
MHSDLRPATTDGQAPNLAVAVAVAVVIPTLAAPSSLRKLLHSLKCQTVQPCQIVVVFQGDDAGLHRLESMREIVDFDVVRCLPGLARARNIGVKALHTAWDAVAIPDDDVVYDVDALARFGTHIKQGVGIVSARVTDLVGNTRLRYSTTERVLNGRDVWRCAIEAGLAYASSCLSDVGGFDEQLGLGAETPWQSGEGTELLLRSMASRYRVVFDPSIVVVEQELYSVTGPVRAETRARRYARGTGRVYALRHTRLEQCGLVCRSLAHIILGVMRRDGTAVSRASAVLVGRVEGLIGRTVGSTE